MQGFNYKKSVQSLNFFAIGRGGKINKMKAIKLVWFADRLHLCQFGRTITGDTYFALPHGPVPSTTRDILESNSFSLSDDELNYSGEYLKIDGEYYFSSNKEPYLKVFSKTDIDSLQKVLLKYGMYSQYQLRDISHQFPEWKRWESALNSKIASRFTMDYMDFFKNGEGNNPLFDEDPEELQLVENLYSRAEKVVL